MYLKPSEIYYSQNSINNVFDKRCSHSFTPIGETLDALCEGRCAVWHIPAVSVIKRDGKWVSADNRRLWVFRQLERLGKCDQVNAKEVFYIPSKKMTSCNGGESVRVRGSPGGLWHLKASVAKKQANTDTHGITTTDFPQRSTSLSDPVQSNKLNRPASYTSTAVGRASPASPCIVRHPPSIMAASRDRLQHLPPNSRNHRKSGDLSKLGTHVIERKQQHSTARYVEPEYHQYRHKVNDRSDTTTCGRYISIDGSSSSGDTSVMTANSDRLQHLRPNSRNDRESGHLSKLGTLLIERKQQHSTAKYVEPEHYKYRHKVNDISDTTAYGRKMSIDNSRYYRSDTTTCDRNMYSDGYSSSFMDRVLKLFSHTHH